jgi:GT2 family glycosyltransferase
MTPIRLVTATRLSRERFWKESLLGQSLRLFPKELMPELAIVFDNEWPNTRGLPEIYNAAIESADKNTFLLFVHDDVFIHDVFLGHRLNEAMMGADVVGLAGSRSSDPRQPSWLLKFNAELDAVAWQQDPDIALSGAVSHMRTTQLDEGERLPPPEPHLSIYGETPAECHLLDGLFLAAKAWQLKNTGLRFDPRFAFHLYDLDFCRSARKVGLKLGTWPILVTHASPGNFQSDAFKEGARRYLSKWRLRTDEELGLNVIGASSQAASP